MKTDTSIATGKITNATTDTSTDSMKPVPSSDDERSMDGNIPRPAEHDLLPDLPDFTPPLRINSGKLGLANSFTTLEIPRKLEKEAQNQKQRGRRSDSASRRSGSQSPAYDGGSSISSFEEMGIDADVLTDKMGNLELDLREQQANADRLNKSCSNLPPVSERLSEATLDDIYAFSDIKREDGYTSRGNSITTGGEVSSNMLEPLDEGDEEDQEDEGKVKIMNMEDILEVPDEEAAEVAASPSAAPTV